MTFRAWLKRQRRRNDPVGDVARDSWWDPRTPDYATVGEWVDYVRGGLAGEAIVEGWREFRQQCRPARRVRNGRVIKRCPRGRIVRAGRSVGPKVRARILERDHFRCLRCGAAAGVNGRLVVDHVVPVAMAGTGADDNLQTLCELCNQGKGARFSHPSEVRGG